MKTKYWLLVCIVIGTICFFAGRQMIQEEVTIKYVQGETIRDTIPIPVPIESVPDNPILIVKRDTIYTDTGKIIVEKVDTMAIIKDYITKRQYAFNVFDNEYGTLTVDSLNVQYNTLTGFHYSHTPRQKVVTQLKQPLFVPFISGSYNSFGTTGIGGGFFYKNVGVEYNYLYNSPHGQSGHLVGVKYKF